MAKKFNFDQIKLPNIPIPNINLRKKSKGVKFQGSKEVESAIKHETNHVIQQRFNIVIALVFVFALILCFRIIFIQIRQADYYATKLIEYNSDTIYTETQRGTIYDRNGKKLAYDKSVNCATYYPVKNLKEEEIDIIVNFLKKNIKIDISSVTKRDKKDFLMLKDQKYVDSLVTNQEIARYHGDDNEDNEIYNLKLSKITDKILKEKLSDDDIRYYKLFYAISRCNSGSVVLIENLSIEEASIIGENSDILRGIKVTNEWVREYPYESAFKQVLGKVTTKKQGLPENLAEKLLALGYSNNSRVGVSGIEYQYENILKGGKASYKIEYDNEGNPQVVNTSKGETGNNIHLTIDMDLQQALYNKIVSELKSHTGYDERFNNHIFVTAMNPNNGEVIAMAGAERDSSRDIYDYSAGNYLNAYAIGSASKGATLYTAFREGVIHKGTVILDAPMYIKGTKEKKSHKNMGYINEVKALEQSSNVYMFKVTIKLGNGTYKAGKSLNINFNKAMKTLRNGFGELGLGVKSGIDVPNEALGYKGEEKLPGYALDMSIGQYDTFTPIQMVTYASTIANKGVKIQPHLFKDSFIKDSEGNTVIKSQYTIKVLDDVSEHKTAFSQIHKGFRACLVSGTGKKANNQYKPAGKTGTAEDYTHSGDTDYPNHTFVGFAPYDDPQIAVSCVTERQKHEESCKPLASYIIQKYFDKYGLKGNK